MSAKWQSFFSDLKVLSFFFRWEKNGLYLGMMPYPFKVIFRTVSGTDQDGYVAIDSIFLTDCDLGECTLMNSLCPFFFFYHINLFSRENVHQWWKNVHLFINIILALLHARQNRCQMPGILIIPNILSILFLTESYWQSVTWFFLCLLNFGNINQETMLPKQTRKFKLPSSP